VQPIVAKSGVERVVDITMACGQRETGHHLGSHYDLSDFGSVAPTVSPRREFEEGEVEK